MRKYLKIFLLRNAMQFQSDIAYRVEVIFLFLNTVVLIGATAILYVLIFSQTKAVGDWGFVPMLYLYAVGNIAVSIYTMFGWGPIYHQFRPAVKTGTMDIFLLKPISPWFMALTGRFDMSGLARLVPSMGLLIYLVGRFPLGIGLVQLVSFWIFFMAGMVLLTLLIFILYCASFWTTSTDYFHHLAWAFISATSQPTSAFPRVVFDIFSTVVPVAFTAVFSVRILAGLQTISWSIYLLLGLVLSAFLVTARLVWEAGLKHYGSVSS